MKKRKKIDLKPYKKTSAHKYVSDLLKYHIISGVFCAGERLPTEIELSETLGISRAATREGLKELETIGLIKTVQGYKGGRFVKKINSDLIANGLDLFLQTQKADFNELMEARISIECITVKMAALNRTEENLLAMSKLLDLRVDSKEEFDKKTFEFHENVALASQNRLLYYIVQAINKLVFQTYSVITWEDDDLELVTKTHTAIYNAIKEHDPVEAEKATIFDINAYWTLYLDVIEKRF